MIKNVKIQGVPIRLMIENKYFVEVNNFQYS